MSKTNDRGSKICSMQDKCTESINYEFSRNIHLLFRSNIFVHVLTSLPSSGHPLLGAIFSSSVSRINCQSEVMSSKITKEAPKI